MSILKNVRTVLVVALMAFPSVSAFSQAPDPYVAPPVTITGVDDQPVGFGEVVQLGVEKLSKVPDGLAVTQYSWKVFEQDGSGPVKEKKRVYIAAAGDTVVFGTGVKPRVFFVVVEANYLFLMKDKDGKILDAQMRNSGLVTAEVKVGVLPPPEPVIPPTPSPAPKPVVVVPDGQFKLARVSYDGAMAVNELNRAVIAQGMGDNYIQIGKNLSSGKISSLGDAYKQLKENNDAIMQKNGGAVEDWGAWDAAVRKAVYQLYLDKRVVKTSDYGAAFNEVGTGLALAGGQ